MIESTIDIICNFQLVIFGIAVTIFTVLYSFIINKREQLKGYSEQLKNTFDPLTNQQAGFAISYISRVKKVNKYLIYLIISSLSIYLLSLISKNIEKSCSLKYILNYFVIGLGFLSLIYIIFILYIVIKQYHKDTKI